MALRITRRATLGLLGAAAVAWPAFADALGPVVRPSDAARRDPALVKVRAAALAAAKAKDIKQIEPHLDSRILIAFGGENGAAAFAKLFAEAPVLWEELAWVLANGGRFLEGEFWAPYTFQANVGTLDPAETGIVVAAKVPARAEPSADAKLVAMLDHHVVHVTDWRDAEKAPRPFYNRKDWVRIELPGQRMAWVGARFVRSMDDYRAGFAKKGGVWKLTGFVSGD
ncbi:MAG TPA: hypothetical protein VIF14_04295 [Alphaproteobacteria bacterium]